MSAWLPQAPAARLILLPSDAVLTPSVHLRLAQLLLDCPTWQLATDCKIHRGITHAIVPGDGHDVEHRVRLNGESMDEPSVNNVLLQCCNVLHLRTRRTIPPPGHWQLEAVTIDRLECDRAGVLFLGSIRGLLFGPDFPNHFRHVPHLAAPSQPSESGNLDENTVTGSDRVGASGYAPTFVETIAPPAVPETTQQEFASLWSTLFPGEAPPNAAGPPEQPIGNLLLEYPQYADAPALADSNILHQAAPSSNTHNPRIRRKPKRKGQTEDTTGDKRQREFREVSDSELGQNEDTALGGNCESRQRPRESAVTIKTPHGRMLAISLPLPAGVAGRMTMDLPSGAEFNFRRVGTSSSFTVKLAPEEAPIRLSLEDSLEQVEVGMQVETSTESGAGQTGQEGGDERVRGEAAHSEEEETEREADDTGASSEDTHGSADEELASEHQSSSSPSSED